jgi:hypothetical protein
VGSDDTDEFREIAFQVVEAVVRYGFEWPIRRMSSQFLIDPAPSTKALQRRRDFGCVLDPFKKP